MPEHAAQFSAVPGLPAPRNRRRLSLGLLFLLFLAGAHPLPAAPAATESPASIEVQTLDGKMVRPFADAEKSLTVLFFVMHECPVANAFAPEIDRIAADYAAKGVRAFLVYVEGDLSPEKARTHAREFGLHLPSVLDPNHRLVRAAGATVSPEVAVFGKDAGRLYLGRIDDRVTALGKRRVNPTRRDLREVLDAVLAGKPAPAKTTRAIGCYIPRS